MIGESDDRHHNPAVHVPPWLAHRNDSTAAASSPLSVDVSPSSNDDHVNYDAIKAALQRYLPSRAEPEATVERGDEADLLAVEEYSSDEFRMYDFKVRRCTRVRAHDWTECPYAHPGEKARRRDPRRFNYSGTACSNFRKGSCHKGEACEFAHGVFECWLHPSRYRTQACKDGFNCKRRVCFFAHSPEELRVVHGEHGPMSITSVDAFDESHAVTPIFESPPVTPVADSLGSINRIVASLRSLQLTKGNSMPSSWRTGSPVFWSPNTSLARPGFYSLPATPIRPAVGHMGRWDKELEVEPVMERVESGRVLRARMFEKLSKENSLDRPDPVDSSGPTPILGGSPIP